MPIDIAGLVALYHLGDMPDLELDPPFSILMWVNLQSLPSVNDGSQRLFSKSNATGDQREWAVSMSKVDDTTPELLNSMTR